MQNLCQNNPHLEATVTYIRATWFLLSYTLSHIPLLVDVVKSNSN